MTYRQFSATPQYIQAVFENGKRPDPEGTPWWSGKDPLPAVGDEIFVKMNNFGVCVVEKYFVQNGWLGVMVRVTNPPDWWVKQTKGENPLAHIFGAELK